MRRTRVLDLQEFNDMPDKAPDEGTRLQNLMLEDELHRQLERSGLTHQRMSEDVSGVVTISQEGFFGKMMGKTDKGPSQYSLELLKYLENKVTDGTIAEEVIEYKAFGVLAHLANGKNFEKAIDNLASALLMAEDFEAQSLKIWTSLIDALEHFTKDDDLAKLKKAYMAFVTVFKPNLHPGWTKGPYQKDSKNNESAHFDLIDSTESFGFGIFNNGDAVLKNYGEAGIPSNRLLHEVRWVNAPYYFYRSHPNEYKHLFRITRRDAEALKPKLLKTLDTMIDHYGRYVEFYKKLQVLINRMIETHNRDTTRIPHATSQGIVNRLEDSESLISAVVFQSALVIRQYVTLVY